MVQQPWTNWPHRRMEPTSSPMFESRTLILATVHGTIGFHLVRGAITRPCLETIWYATLAERGRVVIKKGGYLRACFCAR